MPIRTAHDGREGTFDVAQDVVDGLHLLLHEVAQHLVAGVEVVGDHGRRGVLAVRRSKGVVDIAVGVRSQRLGELLLRSLHRLLGLLVGGILLLDAHGLALLFGVEAEVFEHQRLARFERRSGLGSLGAVGSELDGHAQFFAHGVDDLAQRELGVDLAFGLAHVRHDDEAATVGEHLFQRGKRPADAGVVGDFTVFIQRHVEVHADDRAFALEIVRIDCCHNALNFKVYLNALNPILLSNSGFEPAPEPPAARCGGIRRRSPSSSGGSGRVPQMYAFIFRNTHSSVCKITLRRDFLTLLRRCVRSSFGCSAFRPARPGRRRTALFAGRYLRKRHIAGCRGAEASAARCRGVAILQGKSVVLTDCRFSVCGRRRMRRTPPAGRCSPPHGAVAGAALRVLAEERIF